MLSRQRLFWHPDPYDLEGTEQKFLRAAADNCAYHIRHCPEYAAICDHLGFSPNQLKTMEDLAKLPVLPTLFFKRKALFSLPEWRMGMKVTSSGTSGKFSRIGFDRGCILAEVPMVVGMGFRHGLVSPVPSNCVVLGYKPHKENHTGVTRTMFGLTFFTPPLRRVYALKRVDGAYVPDLDGVAHALGRFAASPFPTRVIGFPSYLWFGLQRMEEMGIRVKLRPRSAIILAGGWKQHYAQQVEKPVLYDLARRVLGIEEENIHELFGAVEHPIFYNTCKRHHFHIPIYSRILIRDPATLEPLPMGKVGLVNLISPLMAATPTLSVMTDDLGYLTPGEECGCGIRSPYLTILGRVGMSDIQTCAAGAAELLPDDRRPQVLDGLEEQINLVRSGAPLQRETVIAAVDRLGKRLRTGEFDLMLRQFLPQNTGEALEVLRPLLSRSTLERKCAVELGEEPSPGEQTIPRRLPPGHPAARGGG